MYRNSNDKRVKHSANQLFEAIETLMQCKTFDDIGIKEVCETAKIGRATFYRNFDYVEDVLKLKLNENFEALQQRHNVQEVNEPVELRPFFEFWVDHSDVLALLMQAERWDFFRTRFQQGSEIRLNELAKRVGFNELEIEYLQNSVNGLFTSALQTWIERGRKESADELLTMFELPFKMYLHRQEFLAKYQK